MNTKKLLGYLRGGQGLLSPPQGLGRADMIAMGCIMASCFFLFQLGDLDYTTSFSHAYLEGHFFDFYAYNKERFSIPGYYYLQPTYLLLALWNVPMKLLGITGHAAQGIFKLSTAELVWNKLLLVIFLALCSITVYKIARLIAEGEEPAKLCMFLFVSNPITIYTIFMFGGYDIFGLAFTMLGLHAFLRQKHWQFILWFSLAIPFKYFAVFPFLPLLLLAEKNIWKILRSLFVAAAPSLLCIFWSLLDPGAVNGEVVLQLSIVRTNSLDIGPMMRPAIFVLAYLAICLFAHFKCADGRQRQKYAILLPLGAVSLIFVCTNWHPQWVILLAPWLALAFLFSPNRTYSLLFETVGSAATFLRIFLIYSQYRPPLFSDYLIDPSQWNVYNMKAALGNFWVQSADGYGVLRGFFQAGIVGASTLAPEKIIPYVETVLLVCLLSPFLLSLMHKKSDWPTPGLFRTETGYLRLRCYGGLAAYLLPIVAVSAAYACFPDVIGKMILHNG